MYAEEYRIDGDMPILQKLVVEGNKIIKTDAILRLLPYKEGEPFDIDKTSQAINHLYSLGHFRQVQLEREDVGQDKMNLYVVL